jgi:hypothetical protein
VVERGGSLARRDLLLATVEEDEGFSPLYNSGRMLPLMWWLFLVTSFPVYSIYNRIQGDGVLVLWYIEREEISLLSNIISR